MKKKMQTGRILNRAEQKRISGGVEGQGGGCIGFGSVTATYQCKDKDGNETGQTVCCKGVNGGPIGGGSGVQCILPPPFSTNIFVYCNGVNPE